MREQFVKEFVTKLVNQIPDDALKIVYQKLTIFVSDYEIEPRKTEIVPYEGYLPECYEIYFATRKIEGLSIRSLELYNMVLRDFFFHVNKQLPEITTNDTSEATHAETSRRLSMRGHRESHYPEWSWNG